MEQMEELIQPIEKNIAPALTSQGVVLEIAKKYLDLDENIDENSKIIISNAYDCLEENLSKQKSEKEDVNEKIESLVKKINSEKNMKVRCSFIVEKTKLEIDVKQERINSLNKEILSETNDFKKRQLEFQKKDLEEGLKISKSFVEFNEKHIEYLTEKSLKPISEFAKRGMPQLRKALEPSAVLKITKDAASLMNAKQKTELNELSEDLKQKSEKLVEVFKKISETKKQAEKNDKPKMEIAKKMTSLFSNLSGKINELGKRYKGIGSFFEVYQKNGTVEKKKLDELWYSNKDFVARLVITRLALISAYNNFSSFTKSKMNSLGEKIKGSFEKLRKNSIFDLLDKHFENVKQVNERELNKFLDSIVKDAPNINKELITGEFFQVRELEQ